MIIGIGIDIVEISRFQNVNEKLLSKLFSEKELSYLLTKKIESTAGAFAAKEAIVKSLGCGFKSITPRCIEITHNINGMPGVILYENALAISKRLGVSKIDVSISHEKKYAIAFAIAHAYSMTKL
jgi:phosphopantetheine--protein transferase-like protein